jgi:hypothetical protein
MQQLFFLNKEQNIQVSDTTGDAILIDADSKNQKTLLQKR